MEVKRQGTRVLLSQVGKKDVGKEEKGSLQRLKMKKMEEEGRVQVYQR